MIIWKDREGSSSLVSERFLEVVALLVGMQLLGYTNYCVISECKRFPLHQEGLPTLRFVPDQKNVHLEPLVAFRPLASHPSTHPLDG